MSNARERNNGVMYDIAADYAKKKVDGADWEEDDALAFFFDWLVEREKMYMAKGYEMAVKETSEDWV